MSKQDYDTQLRKQVYSLRSMIGEQLANCFIQKKLDDFAPAEQLAALSRIIITGCGDSYPAGDAVLQALRQFSGVPNIEVHSSIDVARFLTEKDLSPVESCMIVAISAKGGTARMAEILQKATSCQVLSVLVTDAAVSNAAKSAKNIYLLDMPPMENAVPGLRSYLSCMVGLLAIAYRIGQVTHRADLPTPEELTAGLTAYFANYLDALMAQDEQLFALAQAWKRIERFDLIAEPEMLPSAYFSAMKFYETSGTCCCHTEPAAWCSINAHTQMPTTIGTLVWADAFSPYLPQIKEMVTLASDLGRPVLVMAHGNCADFDSRATTIRLPSPQVRLAWASGLIDYSPASVLAGYHCMTSNRRKKYWRDAETGKVVFEIAEQAKYFQFNGTGSSAIELHK